MVRRLHTGARDDGVDRVHERRDPDGERPRHRRQRWQLPGRDLAAVHGACARGHRARETSRSRRSGPSGSPSPAGSTHCRTTPTPRRRAPTPRRTRRRNRRLLPGRGRTACQGTGSAGPADGRRGAGTRSSSTRCRCPSRVVAVADADGRVVREPALAAVDLPPFPSSAMDGFAVRSADTPGDLPVSFRIAAGAAAARPAPAGAAAGIATGGTVPEGADAVVPVELRRGHGRARRPMPVRRARSARPPARGRRSGRRRRGRRRDAARPHARRRARGRRRVEVVCSVRPRVAVLATGSELRAAGRELAPGQIYESNGAMIAAALSDTGAVVEVLPVVEDDEEAHRAALERGLDADVLVTSGGVSMGPHDLVRRVAAELGVEEIFWGVAVKPGKPLVVRHPRARRSSSVSPGTRCRRSSARSCSSARRFCALPGSGASRSRRTLSGVAAAPLRRNPHRDEFVRARRVETDGRPSARADRRAGVAHDRPRGVSRCA